MVHRQNYEDKSANFYYYFRLLDIEAKKGRVKRSDKSLFSWDDYLSFDEVRLGRLKNSDFNHFICLFFDIEC